ncbi:DUF4019 domain-containing protein [Lysobacter soli]|nr:DUF4019 domain-containing protein [Lysobacter soli]
MHMNRLAALFLLSLMLCACRVSVSTTPEKVTAQRGTAQERAEVVRVADSIARDMDSGDFETVWKESSQILKDATFEVVFTKTLETARGNLASSGKRGEVRVGFLKKLEANLPEGEYSIVEIDTAFEGAAVTEKFVLTRESREWKLAGYFINGTKRFGG